MKLLCLDDYKLVSTYGIKDGVKPEWEAQENLYAHILREHGYKPDRLRIVAILRDWQRSKAQHTADYPQSPVVIIPVRMWSPEECESYILARLTAHADAQHVLPLCSAEERWERPAKVALVKIGNKRATNLHDTRAEAEAALAAAGDKYRIDERPAEQIRCQSYCPAAPCCEQWKAIDPTIRSAGQPIFPGTGGR